MIVQKAPPGRSRFIIRNVDHAKTAGDFAAAFGNSTFERSEPWDLMLFLVENHEEGWRKIDEQTPRDPITGLPFHLVETPEPLLVRKSRRSPDFNQKHHPWCGLLSSMHNWGLYNQRYGLFPDTVSIENVPAEYRALVDSMLSDELQRQERLKAELAQHPESTSWVEHNNLFRSYKLLEFFDTLALYFQLTHFTLLKPALFHHVPRSLAEDCTITAEPAGPQIVRLRPYPFQVQPLDVRFVGRYIEPCPTDDCLESVLAKAPFVEQSCVIVG
jgi:hypothetical protein